MTDSANTKPEARFTIKNIDAPSYKDWKNVYAFSLRCIEPPAEMVAARIASNKAAKKPSDKMGLAYIHGETMLAQNRPLFEALSKVVMRQISFQTSINTKTMIDTEDDRDVVSKKRALNRPSDQILLTDLCDTKQYGMRGSFRNMIRDFKAAIALAGDALSAQEQAMIDLFIEKAEAASRPAGAFTPVAPQAAPQTQRVPEIQPA